MARPTLGDTDTIRFQLKITKAQIEAVNDFRFANRISTTSEAVRLLLNAGLSSHACADAMVKANPK